MRSRYLWRKRVSLSTRPLCLEGSILKQGASSVTEWGNILSSPFLLLPGTPVTPMRSPAHTSGGNKRKKKKQEKEEIRTSAQVVVERKIVFLETAVSHDLDLSVVGTEVIEDQILTTGTLAQNTASNRHNFGSFGSILHVVERDTELGYAHGGLELVWVNGVDPVFLLECFHALATNLEIFLHTNCFVSRKRDTTQKEGENEGESGEGGREGRGEAGGRG